MTDAAGGEIGAMDLDAVERRAIQRLKYGAAPTTPGEMVSPLALLQMIADLRSLRTLLRQHVYQHDGCCISCGVDSSRPSPMAITHRRECSIARLVGLSRSAETEEHHAEARAGIST
jgi:hypothetical protein